MTRQPERPEQPPRLMTHAILFEIDEQHVSKTRPGRFTAKVVCIEPANAPTLPAGMAQLVFPNDIAISSKKPSPNRTFHSFVLTSADGARSYAYVAVVWGRMTPTSASYAPRALCLLSDHPYHVSFNDVLTAYTGRGSTVCASLTADHVREISQLLDVAAPSALSRVAVRLPHQVIQFVAPNTNEPVVDINFAVLMRKLDPANVVRVFNAILNEVPIVFVSHFVEILTPCQEAFLALIYPMKWPFLYIPVLPTSLIDILHCPQPYIVGVATRGSLNEPDYTMVVDLDKNCISGKPDENLADLPARHRWRLFDHLSRHWDMYRMRHPDVATATLKSMPACAVFYRNNSLSSPPAKIVPIERKRIISRSLATNYQLEIDISVTNALHSGDDEDAADQQDRTSVETLRSTFTSCFVSLLANYADYVQPANQFNREQFVQNSDPTKRTFLAAFVQSQMFAFFLQDQGGNATFENRCKRFGLRQALRWAAMPEPHFWQKVYYRSRGRWNVGIVHIDDAGDLLLYKSSIRMLELTASLNARRSTMGFGSTCEQQRICDALEGLKRSNFIKTMMGLSSSSEVFIPISSSESNYPTANAFGIEYGAAKPVRLCAQTSSERLQWVNYLRHRIEKLKRVRKSVSGRGTPTVVGNLLAAVAASQATPRLTKGAVAMTVELNDLLSNRLVTLNRFKERCQSIHGER